MLGIQSKTTGTVMSMWLFVVRWQSLYTYLFVSQVISYALALKKGERDEFCGRFLWFWWFGSFTFKEHKNNTEKYMIFDVRLTLFILLWVCLCCVYAFQMEAHLKQATIVTSPQHLMTHLLQVLSANKGAIGQAGTPSHTIEDKKAPDISYLNEDAELISWFWWFSPAKSATNTQINHQSYEWRQACTCVRILYRYLN